jgi:hypothetical protein
MRTVPVLPAVLAAGVTMASVDPRCESVGPS